MFEAVVWPLGCQWHNGQVLINWPWAVLRPGLLLRQLAHLLANLSRFHRGMAACFYFGAAVCTLLGSATVRANLFQ